MPASSQNNSEPMPTDTAGAHPGQLGAHSSRARNGHNANIDEAADGHVDATGKSLCSRSAWHHRFVPAEQ